MSAARKGGIEGQGMRCTDGERGVGKQRLRGAGEVFMIALQLHVQLSLMLLTSSLITLQLVSNPTCVSSYMSGGVFFVGFVYFPLTSPGGCVLRGLYCVRRDGDLNRGSMIQLPAWRCL